MKKDKNGLKKNLPENLLEGNETILNNIAAEIDVNADGDLCPFIQNPDNNCYCIDIDSSKVVPILYYCGWNFERCENYKKIQWHRNR